jgi:ribosomal protein S18 acetylase RimI-like enzyme
MQRFGAYDTPNNATSTRTHDLNDRAMGLTYFKRFRMEYDLTHTLPESPQVPVGYELVPFASDLIREHATAKYQSFRSELDANVFPCLGRSDGCLRLMREIVSRAGFVPAATWLCRYRDPETGRTHPIGTIQGLQLEGRGAVQNLGIDPLHRGRGLGSILLARAAGGFRSIDMQRMHLEVTTDNTAAIRLYERLGFKRVQVVYKAAEVAGI